MHAGKSRGSPVYGTPWPLSENYYLCVYDRGQKDWGYSWTPSTGNCCSAIR